MPASAAADVATCKALQLVRVETFSIGRWLLSGAAGRVKVGNVTEQIHKCKYTNIQIRKHNTKSKCTGGCSEEQPTVSKQELSPSSRASLMLFPLQFVAAGDVFVDGYHDGDDDDDSICCQ